MPVILRMVLSATVPKTGYQSIMYKEKDIPENEISRMKSMQNIWADFKLTDEIFSFPKSFKDTGFGSLSIKIIQIMEISKNKYVVGKEGNFNEKKDSGF